MKSEEQRKKAREAVERWRRRKGMVPMSMVKCIECGAEVDKLESIAAGWKSAHIQHRALCPECQ